MKTSVHVLLVDDDVSSNSRSERILEEAGCDNVRIALNGGHALCYLNQVYKHLSQDEKLIILLDLNMPIMNGVEFLQNFSRAGYEYRDRVTIVGMISRDNKPEELSEFQRYGVNAFVEKPLSTKAAALIFGNRHQELEMAS